MGNLLRIAKPDLKIVTDGLAKVKRHIPHGVVEHEPEILMGVGLIGFGFTIYEACKATPKAIELRDSRNRNENETKTQALLLDARAMAPAYLKAGISGVASTAAIIGSNRAYAHKYSVLAASASAMEKTLSLYEEKVAERLGNVEADKIRTEIDEECPFDADYIIDGNGETLVYDHFTGHVFRSSREKVLAAQGAVCARIIDELTVPLSELYWQMGLEDDFALARGTGFTVDVKPSIHFSSTLKPDGRVPKLAISYRAVPLGRIFD